MRLILDVTSFQRTLMGSAGRHVFDEDGGVIGRGLRCDWVLPDPDRFVSATHAEISFDGDRFHITDLSTNGVFVNGATAALGKGGNRPISDGDRILLGDFEIVARIEQDTEVAQADPPARLEPTPAVPDPGGTDETTNPQDDSEPDPIPPFPDPAVLAPLPSVPPPSVPPPSVPPPPPRWGGRTEPAPLPSGSDTGLQAAVDAAPEEDHDERETRDHPSTLEAEYNAAIAGLDLENLIGQDDPEEETPHASPKASIPPPPPALGRARPVEMDARAPGRPRPEAVPPSADIPADLPDDIADLIGDPLSPEAIEADLRLSADLPEIERKARLWDEFTRRYRARTRAVTP